MSWIGVLCWMYLLQFPFPAVCFAFSLFGVILQKLYHFTFLVRVHDATGIIEFISGTSVLVHWSFCLYACSFASTTLSRLLYLFVGLCRFWNLRVRALQTCPSSSRLCWLLKVFFKFLMNLRINSSISGKRQLELYRNRIESVSELGERCRVNSVRSYYPWTQDIFSLFKSLILSKEVS